MIPEIVLIAPSGRHYDVTRLSCLERLRQAIATTGRPTGERNSMGDHSVAANRALVVTSD
jgi:hypothetical protein